MDTDGEDPRRCVCATLRKAARSVTQYYDNALRPSGLRATQFNILAEIEGATEASVTQLTNALIIDQTTLTRSLALLERHGLLRPVPKPDRRVKALQLTAKGRRKLRSALPLWAAAQAQMVMAIGPEVWPGLGRELARLAQRRQS